MSNDPISTRPLSGGEEKLQEKFAESIANQSDLMDKLAQQLITLELAIPGLYATVLKLISGDKATLTLNTAVYTTFICWLLALGLTLISLFPRNWQVDRSIMKQDPANTTDVLGIEDFFEKAAAYKRRLLTIAAILFFVGVISAVLSIV